MSLELDFSEITDKIEDDHSPADFVDDALIEAIWGELEGCAEREEIREVAIEVATEFQRAPVTTANSCPFSSDAVLWRG